MTENKKKEDLDLIKACKDGDLDTVKKLIGNGANVNAKNHYGWTALIEASMSGHLKIVQYLVEIGKDKKIYIDAKDNDGSTALIWASRDGHPETVKYLLENDADINVKNCSNSTALIEASSIGHLEIVQCILAEVEKGKKVDINDKDNCGFSALMYALNKGRTDIAECLRKKGADINTRDYNGWTPLMYASKYGYIDVVKYLIKNIKHKADVNIENKEGETALDLAKNEEIKELLTEAMKNNN